MTNNYNLIRNIKKGICKYHYVEIMACPGGCLSGGKIYILFIFTCQYNLYSLF